MSRRGSPVAAHPQLRHIGPLAAGPAMCTVSPGSPRAAVAFRRDAWATCCVGRSSASGGTLLNFA
jgi:hypothetical protein